MDKMIGQHYFFQKETSRIRLQFEQIRTKFHLLINAIAFRIYLSHDAAGMDCPEKEIQTILAKYIKDWPYEALDLEYQR